MTQSTSIDTRTVVATAAIAAETFVTSGGATAAPAGNTFGVARSDAAIGDRFPVDTLGSAVVKAGGAIAKDAAVEVGAGGKAVTLASGVKVGIALQASAADGDRIEVYLIPN